MSNTDYLADLLTKDDDYAGCEAAERKSFEDVPPGRYQVFIEKLGLSRAKSSKRLLLKWELTIAVGPHKGRRLFRNNTVETPDNMRWLKADLQAAGITITKLSELPAILDAETLIGEMLDVTVSVKGTGDEAKTNVYINKRIERGAATSAPTSSASSKPGVSRGLSRF